MAVTYLSLTLNDVVKDFVALVFSGATRDVETLNGVRLFSDEASLSFGSCQESRHVLRRQKQPDVQERRVVCYNSWDDFLVLFELLFPVRSEVF